MNEITLGGRPCCSARKTLAEFRRKGWDSSRFAGKANSYRCAVGPEPGEGWFLMLADDLRQLQLNAFHDLVLSVPGKGAAPEQSVTIKDLIVLDAHRLAPGRVHDPNALMLVHVADRRYLAGMVPIQNRNGTGDDLEDSLADFVGEPEDISDIVAVAGFTAAWQHYEGVSAIHALDHRWREHGFMMVFSPFRDLSNSEQLLYAVRPGIQDDSGITSLADEFDSDRGGFRDDGRDGDVLTAGDQTDTRAYDPLLEVSESVTGPYRQPKQVHAYFPRSDYDPDPNDTGMRYYVVEVDVGDTAGTSADIFVAADAAAFAGTAAAIHDRTVAEFTGDPDGDPDNLTDLQTIAYLLAESYWRSIADQSAARWVYSGPHYISPGASVAEVVWRDYGDGIKTEVFRHASWPAGRVMNNGGGPGGALNSPWNDPADSAASGGGGSAMWGVVFASYSAFATVTVNVYNGVPGGTSSDSGETESAIAPGIAFDYGDTLGIIGLLIEVGSYRNLSDSAPKYQFVPLQCEGTVTPPE